MKIEKSCSNCGDKSCAGSTPNCLIVNQNCWIPENKKNKEQIDHELYENVCWVRSCLSCSNRIDEDDLIKIARGIIESRKQARIELLQEVNRRLERVSVYNNLGICIRSEFKQALSELEGEKK